MPAPRRTRISVWNILRVVKTGMPTQRSSPATTAIISVDIDISAMSKSPNLSWRQKSSDGNTSLARSSMPSACTRPSKSGALRGFAAMPMLSCSFTCRLSP